MTRGLHVSSDGLIRDEGFKEYIQYIARVSYALRDYKSFVKDKYIL